MINLRAHCILAAMLLGLLSVGPVGAEDWSKHWDTNERPELRIHTNDAAVEIVGRDMSGIEAKISTRGLSIGRDGVTISDHQTNNAVDLDVKVPGAFLGFANRSVVIELSVPRQTIGDAHTGDGSITLRGLRGPLRVDTGDGSIRGEGLDGSLDARTGDGSLRVSGRFDNLELRSQDGPVDLTVMPGSRLQSAWHLETGDGNVRVGLPEGLAADLELRTGDGHIDLNLPQFSAGRLAQHEVRGQLNGGGPALYIRTGDGSITLGKR